MEGKNSQLARAEYIAAQKSGLREFRELSARGERGALSALDDLLQRTRVVAYVQQTQREISLARVVGTYTAARANSFSAGFMPLHPENSEFASKWMNLCAIHMSEGLRDPVQVYEYLWQYYVIEGNKRVSILRHFGSPSVRADVMRVVPQLDPQDPQTALYYAFLRYAKDGRFKDIKLSSEESYAELARLEQELLPGPQSPEPQRFHAMYMQFEAAWAQAKPPLPLGDAFLEYLKVYGLPSDTTLSQVREQLVTMAPQMELAGRDVKANLLLAAPEAPTPGIITRIFGARREASVVFAFPEGREGDPWFAAHERGRLSMQEELAGRVAASAIEGLSPANMHDRLTREAKGAQLLLITASHLALPSLRFSLEHPDCLTLVYSRVREDYRLSTYYGRYYEAVYLCGMAAGMATRSRAVAYVTPRVDYTRHTADINAFGLGVRAVCPDAQVLLVWKDVLPGRPETCRLGLQAASALGADTAYTPIYEGMDVPEQPDGVFSVVCRLGADGRPAEYLAAPQWDWGRYYTEIVRSYLSGSLDILRVIDRGDPSVAGLWWGLGAGVLRFLAAESLGVQAGSLLRFVRSQISQGGYNPFFGPVTDKEGRQRVGFAQGLGPYDILNMEWLSDFIRVVE
ncbi:MAG TPA: hypothetical protein VLA21_06005 [Candidatus Limnocylindria bacterium]|nr:hypothetical protein [Candidatus Limnocylindria bacterium]